MEHLEVQSFQTVTQITALIRSLLEPAFNQVKVRGELSNVKVSAQGHAYFSIKDSEASLSAAWFGIVRKRLRFELKDGMDVFAVGRLSVYPPRGTYQLVVDTLEPAGVGDLFKAFEELKRKLETEGLFDATRKRILPAYPSRVVVITSPTGAVLQDIVSIFQRRAPHLSLQVIPVAVQGDTASRMVIEALARVARTGLGDVVVLARGGGSFEDLWPFNDEALARAIAASPVPVISAVGHETDFTIADFVADLRAPTPSAAAEILTQGWSLMAHRLSDWDSRIAQAVRIQIERERERVNQLTLRLRSPFQLVRDRVQRLDEWIARFETAFVHQYESFFDRWKALETSLEYLGPYKVLERGYVVVRESSPTSKVVVSAPQLIRGQKYRMIFKDGQREIEAL